MRRILVLYPFPQDAQKFRPYFENVHVPLIAKLPGLLASRYSFDISSVGGDAPFFCIFEAEFADEGTMFAAVTSQEGQMVAADVTNFATTLPTLIHYEIDGKG